MSLLKRKIPMIENELTHIDASLEDPFDTNSCKLGEGPFWHPLRESLFWFDILNATLYERNQIGLHQWRFEQMVSAAGWINQEELLIASETELFRFNLKTGEKHHLTRLEDNNEITRSNDGRADPWGGFWIGTMGKNAEEGAGAIYRYYRGELRQLISNISISNAICFSPDKHFAYFTDTPTRKIMRVALDSKSGWPCAEPEFFLDLNNSELNPDGAVVDSTGNIWIACWGDSAVHAFTSEGRHFCRIGYPALQISCPAFGGPDLSRLYATSAAVDINEPDIIKSRAGNTFMVSTEFTGVAEPAVIVDFL